MQWLFSRSNLDPFDHSSSFSTSLISLIPISPLQSIGLFLLFVFPIFQRLCHIGFLPYHIDRLKFVVLVSKYPVHPLPFVVFLLQSCYYSFRSHSFACHMLIAFFHFVKQKCLHIPRNID